MLKENEPTSETEKQLSDQYGKEMKMMKYTWKISTDQPQNNIPLSVIHQELASRGVFLDLKIDSKHEITMSINIPDKDDSDTLNTLSGNNGINDPIRNAEPSRVRRGRPKAAPKNDLTLERVRHMLFMNVPVAEIAKEIGVSKRTFYRKWEQIDGKNLSYETPYSQW